MSTQNKETGKLDLYNLNATLLGDVEVRNAQTKTGAKPYAYVKVQAKNEKVVTVMTFFPKGIAALNGQKAGTALRLFGIWVKAPKGRTFAAMGLSPERPAKAAKA